LILIDLIVLLNRIFYFEIDRVFVRIVRHTIEAQDSDNLAVYSRMDWMDFRNSPPVADLNYWEFDKIDLNLAVENSFPAIEFRMDQFHRTFEDQTLIYNSLSQIELNI
jgi:hypothetical protein